MHLLISGRVQGVFFRANTLDKARHLELTGWVKNCYDGKVEAVFEGEEQKLDQVIAWCRQGPSYALVQDVQVTWEEYTAEFNSFNIKGW